MRTLIALSIVLVRSLVFAETMLPAFPDAKIEAPALSLVENAREGMPPVFSDAATYARVERARARAPRLVSRMPIVAPEGNLGSHMLIKAPDESIDYKMLVKEPDMESVSPAPAVAAGVIP